jgi:general secretion pathway protein D
MRYPLLAMLTVCLLTRPLHAGAQTSVESETKAEARAENSVPIERLTAVVAKKTGKKFVLDPRVRADVVLVGEAPTEISYPQFLTVLEVYGFVAVDDGALVRILPDTYLRQQPIPTITSKDTRPASECVTQIVPLKYVSAPQLIPILRPMLPTYAHLAAVPGTNTLLITDRFANVRRIEALARSLDTPENKFNPPKEPEK